MQADSEARIALLRKRAKKGKSKEEDQAEKALERQLQNKGRPPADAVDEDGPNAVDEHAPSAVATRRDQSTVNITTEKGHCRHPKLRSVVHSH